MTENIPTVQSSVKRYLLKVYLLLSILLPGISVFVLFFFPECIYIFEAWPTSTLLGFVLTILSFIFVLLTTKKVSKIFTSFSRVPLKTKIVLIGVPFFLLFYNLVCYNFIDYVFSVNTGFGCYTMGMIKPLD